MYYMKKIVCKKKKTKAEKSREKTKITRYNNKKMFFINEKLNKKKEIQVTKWKTTSTTQNMQNAKK